MLDKRTTDERGNTYGFLVVETLAPVRTPGGSVRWLCRCTCGSARCAQQVIVIGSHLRMGKTRSCGSQQGRRFNDPSRSAINTVIAAYRREARVRRLKWSLTLDECIRLFASACTYCGAFRTNTCHLRFKHALPFQYNGIDRQDNSRGYVSGNAVPCCRLCNWAKRDLSVTDFLSWVERVHAHTKGRDANR